MSILFYRRPDYLSKPDGPVNATDCARYAQRAKNSERSIPPALSFEEIMNGNTLPPCSLRDFMDYLVYVEHNAENLQFYLWFQDYERRWHMLSEKESCLSPVWPPSDYETPGQKKVVKRDDSLPPCSPLSSNTRSRAFSAAGSGNGTSFLDDSDTRYLGADEGGMTMSFDEMFVPLSQAEAGFRWKSFTIQPNREECDLIIQHYLATGSARELNLSYRDRSLVLRSLQHTTHPSAFKPAVKIAEATLRGQSHPNFIRWSICNGNKPRIFVVRTVGMLEILIGSLVALLLVLSNVSRWYRLFSVIFLYLGLTTMIASYKGLCLLLQYNHERALQPWELWREPLSLDIISPKRVGFSCPQASYRSYIKDKASEVSTTVTTPTETTLPRSSIGSSSALKFFTANPPTSAAFLEVFGPRNNTWQEEAWVARYEKQTLSRKIFGRTAWIQDQTVRLLQDRIVLGANLWASIISVPLMVAITALPVGNRF